MKILVVDDDAVDRTLLERLVAKHGHEPVVATNGKEAIERFKTGDISIILMDWMMPGTDGIKATKEIRALEKELKRDCYIIMLTAKTGKEDFLEAVASGVDEFLTKPIDEQILWARIRTGERILNTTYSFEKKDEELKGLWNQLILHNVNLRGQIKTIKDRIDKPVVPGAHPAPVLKSDLDGGEVYLVECPHDGDGPAFKLFNKEVDIGFPGLVMSRAHPDKLRKLHGLQNVEVIWLSKGLANGNSSSSLPLNLMMTGTASMAGTASDENLAAILEVVRDFLEKRKNAVVLFSGIEYLFARFSEGSVMEMLYGMSEIVKAGSGKILVACHPDAVDAKLLAILKREMVWTPIKTAG
jgi:CheY-like chemotaxis protein